MINMDKAILGIKRDDLTDINISIEPVLLDFVGNPMASGVYDLRTATFDPAADESYLGQIAFCFEDKYDWEYIGEQLSNNEVEQVVTFIKEQTSNPIAKETFYVQAFYNGGMNSFEIIPNEGYFGIAYNGKVIAEIKRNEDWEQTSGEPLPKDTFVSIKQAIEEKCN